MSSDALPIDGTFTFTAAGVAGGRHGQPAIASADRPFTGIPAGVIVGGVLIVVLILLLAFFAKRGLGRSDPGRQALNRLVKAAETDPSEADAAVRTA